LALSYVKQPQIRPRKRCSKVLRTNPSHFRLVCKFGGLCAQSHEILIGAFLSRIDGKQQQIDKK